MARKNPVPAAEREICNRLRLLRKETRLSQVVFARDLGIDSSLLASHEYGRVPVRFELAVSICRITGAALWWLAEGKDPKRWTFAFIDRRLREQIPPRMLFSEAYQRFLKPQLEPQRLELLKATRGLTDTQKQELEEVYRVTAATVDPVEFIRLLTRRLTPRLNQMPPQMIKQYWSALAHADRAFVEEHASELEAHSAAAQSQVPSRAEAWTEGQYPETIKKELADISESVKNPDVRNLLPGLLGRLRAATKERGTKSALAEYLGVPLASVSQWLSGEREPGGETTLRLLNWVERQERHSK